MVIEQMDLVTPSNVFRDAFVAKAKAACAKADSIGSYGSPGVRGGLREIVTAELLQEILPPEVKIGSGQLVSHSNELSPQIDAILYAPSIMIPALYDRKNGYFPVESCLYGFEIKTKITRRNMLEAVENARRTLALSLLPTYHWTKRIEDGLPSSHSYGTPRPILALFAFASDLTSDPKAEIARYREIDPLADTNPGISVICIKGRGYWFFENKWKYIRANDDLSEIVLLLAGLSNTLPQFLLAKGRPRVGMYLQDFSAGYSDA